MVDKEELEAVEKITTIMANIAMIITTAIPVVEKLCNIFKAGKHSKK